MATTVIETRDLSKNYGQTQALTNLTLSVEPGQIFGYLGPNGAGKTTTIRLLLDLIRPSSGTARVLGQDVRQHSVELHRRIGFLPGELNLWKGQTARRIVEHIAAVRGMDDIHYAQELAERLKLDMSKRVRDYSTGNKRKLGLVIAMMHRPDLLILDEPTSGLDPLMQQTFNQLAMEAKNEGRTVFLSSHVLSEVQAICDKVAILRDGDLKAVETVERLTRVEFRWVTVKFRETVPANLTQDLRQINSVSEVTQNGESVRLRLAGDFDPVLRTVGAGYVEDVQISTPTLEEIFLEFYGNGKLVAVSKES